MNERGDTIVPKHFYIVLDTETFNTSESFDNPIVYDLGFAVIDKKGKVYEQFSFVIYDTYVLMKDLATTAYYASKFPQYEKDIESGKRKLVNFLTAWRIFHEVCKRYNIVAIMAHNMPFDYRALHTTLRYLTKSKYRFFFPYGIEIWDTLKMARSTIGKQKTYQLFCEDNDYLIKYKSGTTRPRMTAEILYRFITHDTTFDESHTGLEDVLIEKEIFVRCVRQHKRMKRLCFGG